MMGTIRRRLSTLRADSPNAQNPTPPAVGLESRRSRRGPNPWLVGLLLWVTVLAFAIPVASGTSLIGPSATPAVPHIGGLHSAASSGPHAAARVGPAAVVLPSALASNSALQTVPGTVGNNPLYPVNWTKVAELQRTPAADLGTNSVDLSAAHTVSIAPPPAAATRSPATSIPTGSVTGYVENALTLAPIQGVSVQSYSAKGTSNCPIGTCPAVATNVSGGYTVKAPVGDDYLTFTLSYYATNITYVTVYNGVTTTLANVTFLVPATTVEGTVEANVTPAHPIAGVTITCVSRDNSVVGNPTGITASNGYFVAACPTAPSRVTFQAPYGYLSSFVYLNGTPGAIVNLGKVYLYKEPSIKAELYNSVTQAAIPTGQCSPFPIGPQQCNSITVCSSITAVCLTQGPTLPSNTLWALGPAGYDYIKAEATGYVDNQVSIGYVGYQTSGSGVFDAGRIYLTPLGTIGLSVSITHNATNLPTSAWGTGLWVVTAAGLNGLYTSNPVVNPATYTVNTSATTATGTCGFPNGAVTTFLALPVRDSVVITPDTTGACGGPPTWPIPGSLPAWGNQTWMNVTPDMTTVADLNMTVGNYVFGNVSAQGITPPKDFSVIALSVDDPALATYGYVNGLSTWMCNPGKTYTGAPGLKQTTSGFCVAVPPGGAKIVAGTTTSAFGQNFTWGGTSRVCCNRYTTPEGLNQYTPNGYTTINVTRVGATSGKIFQGDTNIGVFFGSFTVQAAGSQPNLPSFAGAIAQNGTVYSPAPYGWDLVTASASGFSPNSVWVYVTGNDSFGNISLTPLATIQGQVVDPSGNGIVEATVDYCPVDRTAGCSTSLGSGFTETDGVYNGTLPGGWLPWATYEVRITASGYTTDWTWVNATAGQSTTVPTITLYPVGTNTTVTHAGGGGAGTGGSVGVYVDGSLIDNTTNLGVQTSGIQACSIATGLCAMFIDGSNTWGYFNGSVSPGVYDLEINALGYRPTTVFFNASLASYLHLGAIQLYELPWVAGNVTTAPWGNLTITVKGVVHIIAFAPGATALGCDGNGSICGTALPLSTQGFFRVLTAGGPYNTVRISPSGGTTSTSVAGGFVANSSVFNATTTTAWIPSPINLPANIVIGGTVMDASTLSSSGVTPWLPAAGVTITVATFGPAHATAAALVNGAGQYLFFMPPGPTLTIGAASLLGVYVGAQSNTTVPLLSTDPTTVYQLPTINVTHYGWLQFQVVNVADNRPAPFVSASASELVGPDSSTGISNGGGQVNMTAPPSSSLLVTVGPGAEFNTTNFTLSVNASVTTYASAGMPTNLGLVGIPAWGWATSAETNSTYSPVAGSILDLVKQLPLPLVNVAVASTDPQYVGSSAIGNWQGQFVTDAPISPLNTLTVTHDAYLSNNTHFATAPNATHVQSVINLTGLGVIAGTVYAYPSGLPIPFATVQTCPYSSTNPLSTAGCYSTVSNASGDFWVAAYPGVVKVTTNATGFVTNGSTIANTCSDCWTHILPVTLNEFAYVVGTLRGLPSGLPIQAATVSACSPLGNPVGACNFQVVTDINGHFVLQAPAGTYILQANDTDYNTSYLPVSLNPGETLPVGTLFLSQFGHASGVVVSSTTLLPVANATVFGCPTWSGGICTTAQYTGSDGSFSLGGAPGPYVVTVLAGGYADSYTGATLKAGVSTVLPTIRVQPLGTDVAYAVVGRVVNASNPTQGIVGATVVAEVNGTPAQTSETDVNGGFAFTVLYGNYELTVSAPGYTPFSQAIVVHQPLSGLIVALSQATYTVSGTVTDGLTAQPLTGVAVSEGGVVLGTTDVNGGYTFALANGTHLLTATYQGGGAVAYAPVMFSITVNGVTQTRNVAMFPPSVIIHGTVADSVSGTALAGAPVTVRGLTVDGVPVNDQLVADANGQFTVTLPVGTYNATASYTGYHGQVVAFSVAPPGPQVTLLLSPVTPSTNPGQTTAPSGMSGWLYLGLGLGLVVVAGLILIAVTRMRSPPARVRAPAQSSTRTGGTKR